MRARLSKAQCTAVARYMVKDLAFEPWRMATQTSAAKYEMEMPAIGWLRIFEAMERDTLNARGQNLSTMPRTTIRARNTLRKALNEREAHPAMLGQGMVGASSLVLPAWTKWDGAQNDWSPYPHFNRAMVALVPEVRGKFTIWRPHEPRGYGDLLAEAAHLALQRALL